MGGDKRARLRRRRLDLWVPSASAHDLRMRGFSFIGPIDGRLEREYMLNNMGGIFFPA